MDRRLKKRRETIKFRRRREESVTKRRIEGPFEKEEERRIFRKGPWTRNRVAKKRISQKEREQKRNEDSSQQNNKSMHDTMTWIKGRGRNMEGG